MSLRLKSLAIAFYLFYIFATGIPYPWRSEIFRSFPLARPIFADEIFPWGTWDMFIRGRGRWAEFIAWGMTVSGGRVSIPMKDFFPPSNHWVLEGNRAASGIRIWAEGDEDLAEDFCRWLGEKYNSSFENAGQKLNELKLIVNRRRFPRSPDSKLERQDIIASCIFNIQL